MRRTATYILRLLLDSDDRDALRGALRSVAHGEELTFASEAALLTLLRQMARRVEEEGPDQDRTEE